MKKKVSIILLALIFVFTSFVPAFAQVLTNEEQIASFLVANAKTGEIYYSKNEDQVFGVASMSKLMTYLIIKDELAKGLYKESDIVEITEESARLSVPGNSRMDLEVGEMLTVKDLLDGLIVVSGNDASVALAIKSAGSDKAFAEKMNQRAKELGLNDSTFVNASGLTEYVEKDGEEVQEYNKMSANDLFKLSMEIINTYPEISEYSKMEQLIMPERNFVGDHTHTLFKSIPSLRGLKSGFTDEAGYNFTGYVDMDAQIPGQKYKLVTIVIGADTVGSRRDATQELITYVSDRYDYKDAVGYEKQIPVTDFVSNHTKTKTFPLYAEKPLDGLYPKGSTPSLSYVLDEDAKAPFEDGKVLGELTVKVGDKEVGKVNLINKGYKPRLSFINMVYESLKDFVKSLMLLF